MESALSKQLFVYSSLRKGFHQHTHDYVSHFFSFVSPAKVKGTVSNVNGELLASPGDGESFIEGELFKLNDEHDFSYVFGQLDDYEGLIVEQGEQPLYRRELIKVYIDGEADTNAWIYWYNGEVLDTPTIAAGNIGEFPT
ncbi:gamma-glutamylcyclotransferase [Ginsengibacter hankyongi]|uniref:Gamma-glutamylcyclotransferase n=1 Tax=Ginsengibacter hankyongi TaxID=2607284 RepID=A0A5J5IF00_9BACT|nr:gamma-glutamylcyclotransferase family protein [Ginsengibacter hankyongi]KAA9038203.1 gamma-glutamylcyclotransferase [Ginsengibacter hankyongi]